MVVESFADLHSSLEEIHKLPRDLCISSREIAISLSDLCISVEEIPISLFHLPISLRETWTAGANHERAREFLEAAEIGSGHSSDRNTKQRLPKNSAPRPSPKRAKLR